MERLASSETALPVVPFIPLIAAGVGGAATIYSANQQGKAAEKGMQVQTAADNRAIELQQQNRTEDIARQEPWRQFGLSALGQLGQLHGFNVPGASAPNQGGGTTQPDFDAFVRNNPDVEDGYQKYAAPTGMSREEWGRAFDRDFGGTDNRDVPMRQVASTPVPNAGQPQGRETQPGGSDPRFAGFFASPDYQFRLSEGTRALNANMATRGLLESGATLRGTMELGQNLASSEYDRWYGRLAAAAGIGQQVNQGLTQSGQATTNQVTGLLERSAASRASSYQQQGDIRGGLFKDLAGIGSGLLRNWPQRGPVRTTTVADQPIVFAPPQGAGLLPPSTYRSPSYGSQI